MGLFPCFPCFWLAILVRCISFCLHHGQLSFYEVSATISAEHQNTSSLRYALLGRYLFRACQESLLDALLPGACQWAAPQLHNRTLLSITASVKIHTLFLSLRSCHNFSCIPSAQAVFSCLFSHLTLNPSASTATISLLKLGLEH